MYPNNSIYYRFIERNCIKMYIYSKWIRVTIKNSGGRSNPVAGLLETMTPRQSSGNNLFNFVSSVRWNEIAL